MAGWPIFRAAHAFWTARGGSSRGRAGRPLPKLGAALAALLSSTLAAAEEEAWQTQLTEQAALIYNGDNRDTRSGDITTKTNDSFSLLNNRLDAQASRGSLVLSLRLDHLIFFSRPDPVRIGLDLTELRTQQGGAGPSEPDDAAFFRQKTFEAGNDLSNRHIDWLIPAKYSASYDLALDATGSARLKSTLGDFHAQFGRGLVLSVRKQDGNDTTIRGARLVTSLRKDDLRLGLTLLAGTGNPLRVDEQSGRYLGVHPKRARGLALLTEAGMPRAIDTDYVPLTEECATSGTCSFVPDELYGAQLEVAPVGVQLSSQASLLRRPETIDQNLVRASRQILTASQGLEVPSLGEFASLYFEGAGQVREPDVDSAEALRKDGYALYGNVDLFYEAVQLSFEGKHYRAFFPLSAGVSVARAREFSPVRYSQVPTTEPVWNTSQFENFNTCVSGGRSRVDVHLGQRASVFAWLGRYDSWAESVANENCVISEDRRNRIWDLATGTELSSADRRSKSVLSVGLRDDVTARALVPGPEGSRVFYREAYCRYDLLFHVEGPYSVQLQGWHRYRNQAVGGPAEPWVAGEHSTALELAPFGNLAFGVEYDTNPLTPDLYFNGQLSYRINSASNLTLFAGQRRGALRCVAGVCRIFPPFEGARLDLTWRP